MDLISGVTHLENRLEKRRTGQDKSALRHRTHDMAENDAARRDADSAQEYPDGAPHHVDTTA